MLNCEKKIGAFFDLDGTVVAPPSLELRFAMHLARTGMLRPAAIGRWLGVFLKESLSSQSNDSDLPARMAAIDSNKAYLAGVPASAAHKWAEKYADSLDFFPDALKQIAWHRRQGHAIFFVSGTLGPLARAVASRLARFGEIPIAATELMELRGRWTGHVLGDAVSGPEKARAMEWLAAVQGVDLARSCAYGNSSADRWMLAAAGHGVAVNPRMTLAPLARRSGWPVVRWERSPPFPDEKAVVASQRVLMRGELPWK